MEAVHAPERSPETDDYRRAFEAVLGQPFFTGNRITRLRNGVEIFPAMIDAIHQARVSIEFLSFIYWTGAIARHFADALCRAARRGVSVYVLLDAFGAKPMSKRLLKKMKKAGVEIEWFRPLTTWRLWKEDNRTHRKVLVCDGTVGFTGGVGIAAEWEGDARDSSEWRDTHFKIEGPAVHGLRAAFIGNWLETGRPLNPVLEYLPPLTEPGGTPVQVLRSTASIGWSDIATIIRLAIRKAEHRLRIASAYFVPDEATLDLLCEAARRGVLIDVLVPGDHTDERVSQLAGQAVYADLLRAGVRLWEYNPTMIHMKLITLDGVISIVGSANFNHRSMRRDDEISVIACDEDLTRRLENDFEEDIARADRLELREWKKRGLFQRGGEQVARMARHQL